MTDLIACLNAADRPDRDLDCEIYISLGAKPPTDIDPLYWTAPGGLNRHYESLVPRYTGSFDAAVTLLPEGVNIIDLVLSWDTTTTPGYPACSIRWYEPGASVKDWKACSVTTKTIPVTVALAAMTLRSRIAVTAGHRHD